MRIGRLTLIGGIIAVLAIGLVVQLRTHNTGQSGPHPGTSLTEPGIPAGARKIAGVVLLPAQRMRLDTGSTDTTLEVCHQAAHTLGFAVACPKLLPDGAIADVGSSAANCPGLVMDLGPGCGDERAYSFASIQFPTDAREGHLVIIGAPRRMSAKDIINSPVPPPGQAPVVIEGTVAVARRLAQVVRVAPSSATALGGHLVLVWTVGAHTYALGFHGLDAGARALDLVVAASIDMVQP